MPVALFERPRIFGAGQPPGDDTVQADEPETPENDEEEEESS